MSVGDLDGVGRKGLLSIIASQRIEIDRQHRDFATLQQTLTIAQEKGTALVEVCRRLQTEIDALRA